MEQLQRGAGSNPQNQNAKYSRNDSNNNMHTPEPMITSGRNPRNDHLEGGHELFDENDSRFFIDTKVVMLGESGVGKSSVI